MNKKINAKLIRASFLLCIVLATRVYGLATFGCAKTTKIYI